MNRLLIHNIGLLATPTGSAAKAGPAQGQILLQNNAWILAEDGLIKQTGTGDSWQQIPQEEKTAKGAEELEGGTKDAGDKRSKGTKVR